MRKLLIILAFALSLVSRPAHAQYPNGVNSSTASPCNEITVICADHLAGADWSVKVNAAYAACGSTLGCTVDARNFPTDNQIMSVNITPTPGDTLLLPCVHIQMASGTQFIISGSEITMQGCGNFLFGGGTIFVRSALDAGTFLTTSVVQPLKLKLSDFEVAFAGTPATGSVGLNLPGVAASTFTRLTIWMDIGIVLGGTAACACYNVFTNVDSEGVTYGWKVLNVANKNEFYSTKAIATSGVGTYVTGSSNTWYSPDEESDVSTASFEFTSSYNRVLFPYLEGTGNIKLDTAVQHMKIICDTCGITDNSGQVDNCIVVLQNPILFGCFPEVVNGMHMGKGTALIASNTAFGVNALNGGSTTGTFNVGIGDGPLQLLTTGSANIGIGQSSLTYLTTGSYNTAVGDNAMLGGVGTASHNVAIGENALSGSSFSGNYNVGIGAGAGDALTSGTYNTVIGYHADNNNVTGTGDVVIGHDAGMSTSALSNSIALGSSVSVSASNEAVIGNSSVTDVFHGSETNAARVRGKLFSADGGIACTNGELALSAGWGSTAAATAVHGTGQVCSWTITASGTGQAANPTITDTLTNPLPSASTDCWMIMQGGTQALTSIQQTTFSATAPIFTFNGTPGAGNTVLVKRGCGP